jgi:hypothetical protein
MVQCSVNMYIAAPKQRDLGWTPEHKMAIFSKTAPYILIKFHYFLETVSAN